MSLLRSMLKLRPGAEVGTSSPARPCLAEVLEERVLMAAARAKGLSGYSGTLSSNPSIRQQQLICDPVEPLQGSSSATYDASMVTLVDYRGGPGYTVNGVVEVDRGGGQGTILQPFDGPQGFFSVGPAGTETGFVQVTYTLVGEAGQLPIQPGFDLVDVGGVTNGMDTHELTFELLPNAPMTAPDYTVFAAPAGSHSGNAGDFLVMNDANQTRLESGQLAPAMVESNSPSQITDVYVRGSAWQGAFLNYLQDQAIGDLDFGYRVPDPGAASVPLPFANLDTISLRLNGAAPTGALDPSAVQVVGSTGRVYTVRSLAFDTDSSTLTIRFNDILRADRLTINVSPLAAGNTARSAQLTILPGDVNQSGGVLNATDLVLTRNRVGRTVNSPGAGNTAYTPFNDVNGDAAINATDLVLVRNRVGSGIPSGSLTVLGTPRLIWRPSSRDLVDELFS